MRWKLNIKLFHFHFPLHLTLAAERKSNTSCSEHIGINYRWKYRNISSTISLNKQHPLCQSRLFGVGSSNRHLNSESEQRELPRSFAREKKSSRKWQSSETDIKLIYIRFYIFLCSFTMREEENIIEWISDERKADIDNDFRRSVKASSRLDNCSLNNEREGI